MNSWFNQTINGNGGLNRKPQRFKDLGDYSIDTLVRELIQNSLDAKLPKEKKIKIRITIKEIEQKEFNDLVSFIGKDQIELYKTSYDLAIQDVKVKMNDGYNLFTKDFQKQYSLIIEEYNTIGLTGSVLGVDDKSNFDSLLRKTDNNEAKKEIGVSGGTWGKGSSIFTFTSKCWMWFAYSSLSDTWNDSENKINHLRRFMGRCMIAPFFDRGEKISYTGDGWFSEKKYNNEPYPFINETADDLAEELGLTKREQIPGTTFYIPFFNPQLEDANVDIILEEFKAKILQNWFIPIYNDKLEIEIKNSNYEIFLNQKSISETPELKYKNEILDWYYSGTPKRKNLYLEEISIDIPAMHKDYVNEKNKFAAKKSKANVDLAIRLIEENEDYIDNWNTCNKVFLTRNQGMLISYFEPFNTQEVRFECIFFGGILSKSEKNIDNAKHLDLFLAYSENPAHNKWCDSSKDYNNCFLDRFAGRSPLPETLIGRVYSSITNSLKKFVLKEKKANTSKDICSVFKKMTRLKSVGDELSGKSLFFMRTPDGVSNPTIDEFGRYNYTLKFISNSEEDNICLKLKPFISSLEGEKSTDFESLNIKEYESLELLNEVGEIISDGNEPCFELMPGEHRIIRIRTCPIANKKAFKNILPLIKARAIKSVLNE